MRFHVHVCSHGAARHAQPIEQQNVDRAAVASADDAALEQVVEHSLETANLTYVAQALTPDQKDALIKRLIALADQPMFDKICDAVDSLIKPDARPEVRELNPREAEAFAAAAQRRAEVAAQANEKDSKHSNDPASASFSSSSSAATEASAEPVAEKTAAAVVAAPVPPITVSTDSTVAITVAPVSAVSTDSTVAPTETL